MEADTDRCELRLLEDVDQYEEPLEPQLTVE